MSIYQHSRLGLSIVWLLFTTIVYAENTTRNLLTTQDELVIPYDFGGCEDEVATAFIVGSTFWCMVSTVLLITFRSSKLFYLFLATEIITGSLLASSLWFNKWIKDENKGPAALLNENGIWHPYFGVIIWDAIEKVVTAQAPFGPTKGFGIRIKEAFQPIIKEQSLMGKNSKFYNASSYGYHIFVPTMTIPLEEITSFAKRFVKD